MYCKHCSSEKVESMFYASNKTQCKECVKSAVRANRTAKIEQYRAFDKSRANLPHRIAAREAYAKTDAYAKSHVKANQVWTAKHPDRRSASHAVNNAVRDGKLERQPCWVCGNKAQGHHPDYSRPLDVVWLCPSHHKQAHAAASETTQAINP